MHKLGIYSRLDQVFDAPSAVKDVLISQSGLEHSVTMPTLKTISFNINLCLNNFIHLL